MSMSMSMRGSRPRVVATVASLLAAATTGATPAAAQRDPTAAGVSYRVPGIEQVTVERDLLYRTAPATAGATDTMRLALDVYRPPQLSAGERRPALVFVHGGIVPGSGSPLPKAWGVYTSWGRLAAASGFVGITFNHRLTIRDNVDEGAADLEALLGYVRTNAARLNVDPDRLCIAVFSAGGPLASVLLRDPRPYVRCVVLYYPYLDLEHLRLKTPFREPYPPAHADSLAAYSPVAALAVGAGRLPPIFLARAGRDAIPYLNASVARFVSAAVEANAPLDFYIHPSGAHGFDVANRDARSREIVRQTIEFVRRHTGLVP